MDKLDSLANTMEHLGRLNVIKPTLEWALKNHAVIPQQAIDELTTLLEKLRAETA